MRIVVVLINLLGFYQIVNGWHDLGNTDFHCWPLSATANNPVPYASCPGIDMEWTLAPPEELKAQEHFNVSYRLILHEEFWSWAVADQGSFKPNFFAASNVTGIKDPNAAKEWCAKTKCPDDIKKATQINCCIHHVNVHSCPLADVEEVKNGLCGPWIPAAGSIFTHSEVLIGNSLVDEWVSTVEGLYEEGLVSIIAHFKLAGMHLALERTITVKPRTECGDGLCETEEGEACDTCPRDCGRCPLRPWQIGIIGAVTGAVVLVFAGLIAYFRYKQQKLLWDESWVIAYDEINYEAGKGLSKSRVSVMTAEAGPNNQDKQRFTKSGIYNGRAVAIKELDKKDFSITMSIRREVRDVRQLEHPQLVRFVGACVEPEHVAIVTEYCKKGGLNDVLENEEIPINWSFRFSFASDVCKAMEYLHSYRLSHGRLKSSNCVVDDRWTVKVTDYGLTTLRMEESSSEVGATTDIDVHRVYLAPELQTTDGTLLLPPSMSADVYAFAIILVEIATRAGPYGILPAGNIREVARMVAEAGFQRAAAILNGDEDPLLVKPGWKPPLPHLESDGSENTCPRPEQYVEMISNCMEENPSSRPTFEALRRRISKINPDRRSPVDMMMAMMEKYSTHLEVLVAERTADLEAEKLKTDRLLYSMLPQQVADELRQGHSISAVEFENCSIYFSDIVGFTTLCSASTPIQVVELLNKLYTTFDSIIDEYDVYKVETIGDAYMVVSGVPRRNGNAHAEQIALMSLNLMQASRIFTVPHVPDYKMRIRIGIHTGPVCAGVVGLKMPRYCLFGDTVNTASRMESNGEAHKIHVSDVTREYLEKCGFSLTFRGTIPVKGKGEMNTFWLVEPSGQK